MNLVTLIASIGVISVFAAFAVILWRGGLKDKLNRSCFLFISAFAIWLITNYVSNIGELGITLSLIVNRWLFGVSVIVPYLVAGFVADVVQRKRSSILFRSLTVMTILAGILALSPFVVESVALDPSNTAFVTVRFGYLANLYFLVIFLLSAYILSDLVLGVMRGKSVRIKSSSRTLLLTIGFAVIAMLTTNVVLPVSFGIFEYSIVGLLFGALAIAGVGYSVARHGLFDVRFAVVRSVTYSLVLVTLACVYAVVAFVLSNVFNYGIFNPSQTIGNVLISLLLAVIFQPVKSFFDKITNRFFYKDNYNTEDFFARLNRTLTITTDLRNLLERASYEIGTTMKSEQAFFYIYTEEDHYVSAGTERHRQLPRYDANKIGQNFDKTKKILIASLMEPDDPIRKLMVSHRIELILTLIHDDKIVGYLCLGEHLTSGYTNRDVRALNTISNELVIAIQNALAVNEVKELNATLQQKVANATKELRSSNAILRQLDKVKDEFISMASHQLRTPLTSVKGYISMVIEGDAGKISESQKKLLNEAFMSSERMVHLINDFLNVSRIQSGKFMIDKTAVDLVKLVQEEIDGLKPNADARGMKFKYTHPKDFPQIYIDEGKMRQVVMNFADNAIYYSHDKSVIDIFLGLENNEITFYVKDKGIGVPEKEKEHLFTKFYRADNARVQRPDGTGVGIYLAKKVIDAHGGKIIFDSIEGKGSTFGFGLPLNVVSTAPSGRLESEQVPQL